MSDNGYNPVVGNHPFGDMELVDGQVVIRFYSQMEDGGGTRYSSIGAYEIRHVDIQEIERLHESLGEFIDDYYAASANGAFRDE